MLTTLKSWFDPPSLAGDAEQTMRVNLLNANMIFINIYLLLVMITYLFGVPMSIGVVIFDGLLFIFILLLRYWLFQGHINAACIGLLLGSYITTTLVVISMGSVTSPATNTFVLITLLAGIFFQRGGVLVSATVISVTVLALIMAENAGLLPAPTILVLMPQWLTYSIVFLVAGSLIQYVMQAMRKALQALRMENEERKHAALLQQAVYSIAEAAHTAQSLQDLYAQIQNHVSQVMDVGNFSIALYNEKTARLDFVFVIAESNQPTAHPNYELTGQVFLHGRSLLYQPGSTLHSCAVWLGVPLVVAGKVIGVMALEHRTDPQAYTAREQHMLEFVSSQVATAIERKQTEQRLRESNQRFEQIAAAIQETFWIIDTSDNRVLYVSPAYAQLWGVTDDFDYPGLAEFIASILPEDRSTMLAAMEKQNRGMPTDIRYRIQRANGSVRWVWDRSSPVFDEDDQLVRKVAVVTDITEVMDAEAALAQLNLELEQRVEERTTQLRQSEETYRALFENSNDGIFLLSPNGDGLKANQRALEMIGYTLEEYRLLSLFSTRAGQTGSTGSLPQVRAVASGANIPLYESFFTTRDNRRLDVEINLSPVRDTSGTIVMVQAVVRDITARKKADETLRQNRDELGAANLALAKASRLKDEFLASMSHELRTPLTGILGIAEALQMQFHGNLNDRQLKGLKNIETSGHHLLDLINDILDLSKIEADKLDLHIETCQVSDICNASLQLTRGMAHQKHQMVEFSTNIPGAALRADPRRLKQMLVNLLSNAIKFTPEHGSLGLSVDARPEQHLLAFIVWDRGIGIGAEDISRLFQPFVQLDAGLARQYSGTGLGLSLVDKLARLHGGHVTLESTPGHGSRFTLLLPWQNDNPSQVALPVDKPVAKPNYADRPAQPAQHSTILLADDDPLVAETFTDFLSVNGYQMVTASNGFDLLRLAPECLPDLILADIQMPGMDGLQAIEKIRALPLPHFKKVPIIAITALVMPGDEEKCLQAGANQYVGKPIPLASLLELVQKLIPPTA